MKKQDRKRENTIRKALTNVCNTLLESQRGFLWLTHTVDFKRFPESLTIVLVFENEHHMQACRASDSSAISCLITTQLRLAGIELPKTHRHIQFDNEEECDAQHNGNWAKRLTSH